MAGLFLRRAAADSLMPTADAFEEESGAHADTNELLRSDDSESSAAGRKDAISLHLVGVVAALGGWLFGYDMGIIAGTIEDMQVADFPSINDDEIQWIVSTIVAGAIFGSALTMIGSDRVGRRPQLLACSLLYSVAALVVSSAETLRTLLVGRFLTGVAVGASALIDCMYISELSPASTRGTLVSLNELFIAVGFASAYVSNWALSGSWRVQFIVPMIPALIQGVMVKAYDFPESPRFLVSQGKLSESWTSLLRVRSGTATHTVLQEWKEIANSQGVAETIQVEDDLADAVDVDRPPRPALLESARAVVDTICGAVRTRSFRIGLGLVFLQQLSGQPTLLFYLPRLFAADDASESSVLAANVVVGLVKLAVTVVAVYMLIDRTGRRPLLLIGSSAMTVCMLSVFAFSSRWVAIVSVIGFVAAYALSFAPVTWLLLAEVFPQHSKGVLMGVCVLANWITNWVVSATFLDVLDYFGGLQSAALLYAAINATAFAFIYYAVPETKGKTLEAIHESLYRVDAFAV